MRVPLGLDLQFCPECGSRRVVKNGSRHGQQQYRCRGSDCGFQFVKRNRPKYCRFPGEVMAKSIELHVKGLSYPEVAYRVKQEYAITDADISRATVFRWMERFVPVAVDVAVGLSARTSGIWSVEWMPLPNVQAGWLGGDGSGQSLRGGRPGQGGLGCFNVERGGPQGSGSHLVGRLPIHCQDRRRCRAGPVILCLRVHRGTQRRSFLLTPMCLLTRLPGGRLPCSEPWGISTTLCINCRIGRPFGILPPSSGSLMHVRSPITSSPARMTWVAVPPPS